MWPFKTEKKVRFVDLLTRYFGEGPDGPVVIASDGEFVRSFPWIRFTCKGLDYCLERDRVALKYGYYVQVGRADRPTFNEDMFYWEDIQVALGDPESSRDIHHFGLEQGIAALSGLESQLSALFSGDAYVSLRAIRAARVEAQEAERRRLRQPAP